MRAHLLRAFHVNTLVGPLIEYQSVSLKVLYIISLLFFSISCVEYLGLRMGEINLI